MKNSLMTVALIGATLSAPISYSQCPGTVPMPDGLDPLDFNYTIDIEHLTCAQTGSIDVTFNEPLPPGTFIFVSFDDGPYTQVTPLTMDIPNAAIGDYSYAFLNFANLEAAVCNFTIGDATCLGDMNQDGAVTAADLTEFLGAFGTNNPCADMDSDGDVDADDNPLFIDAIGTVCPVLMPIQNETEQDYTDHITPSTTQKENLVELFNLNLSLYPNPTNSTVNISLPGLSLSEENSQVFITDISGRTIENYSFNFLNNNIEANVSNLSKGLYIVTVQTNNHSYSKRLLVQ